MMLPMKRRSLKKYRDLQAVINLQRDMSFAEQIATAIIGMTKHRDKVEYSHIPVLLNYCSEESAGIFAMAWDAVDEKMKEYDSLKSENEELKKKLKEKSEV